MKMFHDNYSICNTTVTGLSVALFLCALRTFWRVFQRGPEFFKGGIGWDWGAAPRAGNFLIS